MNWPKSFQDRLTSWHQLRASSSGLDQERCLIAVNQWWFAAPWSGYYLHWDDCAEWPDPWQLLQDNIFCSVARGLGIMYTLALLDRDDLDSARLIQTKNDNLVMIHDGKYVLNWDGDRVVNINLTSMDAMRSMHLDSIKQRIR